MSVRQQLISHWPHLSTLLDEALDLPTEEHGAWLRRLAPEHAPLKEMLSQLLGRQREVDSESFLERSPQLSADATAYQDTSEGAPAPGLQVGPYRLLHELGKGGMSDVWLAEPADGQLKRSVALKLPHLTWSPGVAERMARERDILATLTHPSIARLYDAGLDTRGRPYLAIEYVQGQALDTYCKERSLDVRARLALVLQVADAVAYAHSQLVIHRDLKPDNILVTDEGQVRLLDFGIAKLVDGHQNGESTLTLAAGRAMTLDYASPEQVRGEPLSTASDVYSLGVVAYVVLTGAKPYRLQRDSAAAMEEAILAARVPAASSQPGGAVQRKALRGDLDAILNMALQADVGRRYASVEAFARDVRQHLAGAPVAARPDAWTYRTGKALRRHWLLFVSAGVVLMAIVDGAGVALWQARSARLEAARANAVQHFLLDIFATNSSRQPDPEKARATTARELLDIGNARLEAALKDQPAARAEVTDMLRDMYEELGLTEQSAALGRQAAALAAERWGADSLQHLEKLALLASTLNHAGGMTERQAVLAQGIAILGHLPDRPSFARMRLYLDASEFHRSGDMAQAVHYGQLALADARALGDAAELAQVLGSVGHTSLMNGNAAQAQAQLSEALRVGRSASRAPGFDLLRTQVSLGEAQSALLHYDAAEATLRGALAESIRINGPAHLDSLQTRYRLGNVLEASGRLREAEAELRQARTTLQAEAERDDFTWSLVQLVLGETLLEKGDLAEAESVLREGLAVRDKIRPGTLVAAEYREKLAEVLADTGRQQEAQNRVAEAAAIRRAKGGQLGQRSWSWITLAQLHLARARNDLPAQRLLMDELAAGLPAEKNKASGWLNATLLRARFEFDDHRPAAALARLQSLRTFLREQQASGAMPLVEAQRHWLCGRAAQAAGNTAQAMDLYAQARRRVEGELLPTSDLLRAIDRSEAEVAALPGAASAGIGRAVDCL